MSSASRSAASAASTSRTAVKRLLNELEKAKSECKSEEGIERIGTVTDENLFEWEAVMNGKGVGHGYDAGRWLLRIHVPPEYPQKPPKIRFITPIVHANVALDTGEICLDLLKDAWSPVYSVLQCLRAVRMLLAHPGIDSPLNVDLAALLREGDVIGARGLVECWCRDPATRYSGP